MTGRVVKASILILWAGLMVWQALEVRARPAPEKIEAAFLADYADYFAISSAGKKIGWSYKTLRRLPDGSYQAGDSATLAVAVMGREMTVSSNLVLNLDRALNLSDFQYVLQAGAVRAVERGVSGDGKLTLTVSLGEHEKFLSELVEQYKDILGDYYAARLDFSRPVELSAPKGPLLAAAAASYINYSGLAEGRNYLMPILDPFGRAIVPLNVRVEEMVMEYDQDAGRRAPVYKLRLAYAGNVSHMWVDRYGRTVREESAWMAMTRVDDQNEAMAGLEPLTPPPALMRMLEGENRAVIEKYLEMFKGPSEAASGG
ncbi:MAG: hypothetical protein LBS31_10010 [Candidatus Adiutrix sp.]|jgi:hypothetical protein|nr:hypothetical protein [Candidatus Adiutrix sp.]